MGHADIQTTMRYLDLPTGVARGSVPVTTVGNADDEGVTIHSMPVRPPTSEPALAGEGPSGRDNGPIRPLQAQQA